MSSTSTSRWLILFCLVVAGEMVFSLPFHIARYFRPTMLEVFGLSNADLGDVFAIYGITAMLAYFPGGIIADQFSARKLISLSLFATALGGIYMARIPEPAGLLLLFGYWGLTSILLLWAALISATRDWGGSLSQGKAFGLLDGGRGLVAALFATIGVIIFSWLIPEDVTTVNDIQRRQGIQDVIYYYTGITALVAILAWFVIPEGPASGTRDSNALKNIMSVSRRPAVWLLAGVVIFAYCGYKGLDNYGLYAVQVLAMDEIESARFTSTAAYLRPVAAISAGIIADRITSSRLIGLNFTLLALSYFVLSIAVPGRVITDIIYLNLIITFVAVFAIRGVYFALLEEFRFPDGTTGTAVGIVSVIGFTPDIFFAPVAGRILDSAPGVEGHQHFYWLLTVISVCGILTSYGLMRLKTR